MPRLNFYVEGLWNFTCDECGRGFKSSAMTRRWDGAMVCNTGSCNEERQPQDFVRGVKDNPSVPVARFRTGLPVATGLWVNDSGSIIPWANYLGSPIPWTLS